MQALQTLTSTWMEALGFAPRFFEVPTLLDLLPFSLSLTMLSLDPFFTLTHIMVSSMGLFIVLRVMTHFRTTFATSLRITAFSYAVSAFGLLVPFYGPLLVSTIFFIIRIRLVQFTYGLSGFRAALISLAPDLFWGLWVGAGSLIGFLLVVKKMTSLIFL